MKNTKYLKWGMFSFCLVCFFYVLLEYALQDEIIGMDIHIYQYIHAHFESETMTMIAKFVSHCCHALTVIGIAILSLLCLKDKRYGIYICINLALAFIINVILKFSIQRPRPDVEHLVHETSYSFPSSHAMVSMSFYGFIIYLIHKYIKNSKKKWMLIIFLFVLILCIGCSRIYLGVHYPSDIIGGFTVSIVYLTIYTTIVRKKLGGE